MHIPRSVWLALWLSASCAACQTKSTAAPPTAGAPAIRESAAPTSAPAPSIAESAPAPAVSEAPEVDASLLLDASVAPASSVSSPATASTPAPAASEPKKKSCFDCAHNDVYCIMYGCKTQPYCCSRR